jgi:hypothetical protein
MPTNAARQVSEPESTTAPFSLSEPTSAIATNSVRVAFDVTTPPLVASPAAFSLDALEQHLSRLRQLRTNAAAARTEQRDLRRRLNEITAAVEERRRTIALRVSTDGRLTSDEKRRVKRHEQVATDALLQELGERTLVLTDALDAAVQRHEEALLEIQEHELDLRYQAALMNAAGR